MPSSPAFGAADLTNCERELIHLAGSVQPHGVLLTLSEPDLRIVQASANCSAFLGRDAQSVLAQPLEILGGDIDKRVRQLVQLGTLAKPVLLQCVVKVGDAERAVEGMVHRAPNGVWVVEIEPALADDVVDMGGPQLLAHLESSVQAFTAASTIGTLADAVVRRVRDLIGYDRVMVYRFDPDGHGKVIAEARDPRLESFLFHHYPASDIPQRARELYLRTRLRVLVDVNYEPSVLVPRQLPASGEELDMSSCNLRSMSPLHLQYLRNMGVTATLVVSLVREGRLWGLIACHHYAPRNLRHTLRAAVDLMAEVAATRIAAIENYAHAQVAIQVRRLEQRLIEATSTEGDWRLALFRNPHTLLQPVEATGAALYYEGEILTSGEVPSTPELRALVQWVREHDQGGFFSCSSIARENPALDSLTPTASGVLAVRLSDQEPDYLLWFRKEQLLSVTWAGDPTKPIIGNDPMELSPRRSFAAWSEIVRGTALPWNSGELTLARALGGSLADIILQVNAVRLLIADHQLSMTRAAVAKSQEPVVIADAQARQVFANDAFYRLIRRSSKTRPTLEQMVGFFTDPAKVQDTLATLVQERRAWRGELELERGDGTRLAVGVRAEVVPARDGSVLGFFLIFDDLTDNQRVAEARRHLEQSLLLARRSVPTYDSAEDRLVLSDSLMASVLTNASIAAMDIADGSANPSAAGLLEEIDASTQRAAELYAGIRNFMVR